jgi:hypothetical protein
MHRSFVGRRGDLLRMTRMRISGGDLLRMTRMRISGGDLLRMTRMRISGGGVTSEDHLDEDFW